MNKIPTFFEREPTTHKVYPVINSSISWRSIPGRSMAGFLQGYEKLNGTNVRLTIRGKEVVRYEKRRNPTKKQKEMGVVHPWYVEANETDPNDKYIFDAIVDRGMLDTDGEWTAELVGPKVNGNPHGLMTRRIIRHPGSYKQVVECFPRFSILIDSVRPEETYEKIRKALLNSKSLLSTNGYLEGVVFYKEFDTEPIAKIKLKDYPEVD